MTFSEKLATLRKESGDTQESFAEAMGVSRQTVSKWEAGTAMPDVENLLRISEHFGVTTDELLRGEKSMAPMPEDEDTSSEEETDAEQPQTSSVQEEKRAFSMKSVIAAVLVVALILGIVVVPTVARKIRGGAFAGEPVKYTYVLVHGLGGFGESKDEVVSYWGATTGSLPQYLREKGYTVCVPTVGPYSSTWDRTCELYAQLTGTQVDYGAAHSQAHGHERFGKTYTEPMVPDWGEEHGGQRVRINLIGHSFGGATVRMLTHLMANGDAAEKKATGKDTSELFTGKKADWVFSVTTLSAPHNGSQLTCIVDEIGSVAGIRDTTQLLVNILFKAVQAADSRVKMPELMLDQFGIGASSDNAGDVTGALQQVQSLGNDHAFYDLSPDGAAELNEKIETVKNVYYFSYAYNTVTDGKILGGKVPLKGTLPVLMPTAMAMGAYKGTSAGGIVIDDQWLDNDGLVSVVSAQYPTGQAHTDLSEQIDKGVWNVLPVREGDHGTPVGLNADKESTHKLYDEIFGRIESLDR